MPPTIHPYKYALRPFPFLEGSQCGQNASSGKGPQTNGEKGKEPQQKKRKMNKIKNDAGETTLSALSGKFILTRQPGVPGCGKGEKVPQNPKEAPRQKGGGSTLQISISSGITLNNKL